MKASIAANISIKIIALLNQFCRVAQRPVEVCFKSLYIPLSNQSLIVHQILELPFLHVL